MTIVRWLVIATTTCAPVVANEYRSLLEDVLFYQRLVATGNMLSYQTYVQTEQAALEAGRRQEAKAAVLFAALGLLEMKNPEGALEALDRQQWDEEPSWQMFANDLRKALKSELDASSEGLLSINNAASVRAAATCFPQEISSEKLATYESESVLDQMSIARAMACSGGVDYALDTEIEYAPALALVIDEENQLESRFFDPAMFRVAATLQTLKLFRTVQDASDTDQQLIRLWCLILLGQAEDAERSVLDLSARAKHGELAAAEIEELQYLGLMLFALNGEHEKVGQFLRSRSESLPTSPWALRAATQLTEDTEVTLAFCRQASLKITGGKHPFSREVLTNIPKQQAAVLDCFWETARAYSIHAMSSLQEQIGDVESSRAVPHAQQIMQELSSPTVSESWRGPSALRIGMRLEAGLLNRDTESWQLTLDDDLRQRHSIFGPLVHLSRTYAMLERTRPRPPDIDAVANHQIASISELLTSVDGPVSSPTGSEPELPDPANESGSVMFMLFVPLALIVGITLIVTRHRRSRT